MALPSYRSIFSRLLLLALILSLANVAFAAKRTRKTKNSRSRSHRVAAAKRTPAVKRARVKRARPRAKLTKVRYVRPGRVGGPVIRGGPWTEPTYADSTAGDHVDGEDLNVRRAAVEALGSFNGSVVVVDPRNGRILTMVNQKLALGSGFQPCSTIKVAVALAGLNEGLITPTSNLRIYRGGGINLTQALARSNNAFFANVGRQLGFEKVEHYARLFGYGEKAGLDIPGESPGRFPAVPPRNGGVGMLTSFGEDISQTPLQLAALMSAMANGGTLYYLQFPRTRQEAEQFVPRVKRHLEISGLVEHVKPGMRGAVEFGTARRARQADPIAGKTGTCTEARTHLGWFGSFNEVDSRKLVVVVLLTGGRPAIGPMAADIAGQVYRTLADRNYSASSAPVSPASLVSTQICCTN